MTSRKYIELLSPAKNLECGMEAINHGADAVYIGAPKFSARAAAPNNIQEIETLVRHAHRYFARVYVALNTILTDEELEEAEKIILRLYEAGVDALIIQDMGITRLNLPPLPLHASTQTDNRTLEKVRFLESAGFEQVVLARELSLEQIREIAAESSVRLEAFVHGALCVSYSGQCYLSQALCSRSANKGACSQPCRLPYSLVDSDGKSIIRDKHLLSLKDLNLSGSLSAMLDAGISSFKIEGRLKDVSYVKNITAFYRRKLDDALAGSPTFKKSSSGSCSYTFMPDPEKSFQRGSTDYFLNGRNPNITSFDTPKSSGEYIGTVKSCNSSFLTIETNKELSNGDGFCFLDESGHFSGFRANRTEQNKIYPAELISISTGTVIYRNFNQAFERILSKKSSDRKISVRIIFSETASGFLLQAIDEDGISVSLPKDSVKEKAVNQAESKEQLVKQLSKTGNTPFTVSDIELKTTDLYFIPFSFFSQWKRELMEALEIRREKEYPVNRKIFPETSHPYPIQELDYKANVHNRKAMEFYKKHDVGKIDFSFENQNENQDKTLMFCKHCLKYSIGLCPKNRHSSEKFKEPFFLIHSKQKLLLHFDCKQCEMEIKPDVRDKRIILQ